MISIVPSLDTITLVTPQSRWLSITMEPSTLLVTKTLSQYRVCIIVLLLLLQFLFFLYLILSFSFK